MEGEPPTQRSYHHVAFSVADADLPQYRANLQALGVEIRPSRPRIEGEGQSLYFYDFDNHLFELHTGTLEQRLAQYDQQLNQAEAASRLDLIRASSSTCLSLRSPA